MFTAGRLYANVPGETDPSMNASETVDLSSRPQTAPKMKMTTRIPSSITTPDSVDTRLGTLKFFDGFPDDQTVEKVMDNLDFSRGVQAFLSGMPGTSLVGMRTGFQELGAINGSILLFENLLDSKSLFLTGNTDSVYFSTWLNLKDGPLVLEAPPRYSRSSTTFGFSMSSILATPVLIKV
jgi:hypothetical protein